MHTGPNPSSSHDIEVCRSSRWRRSGTFEKYVQNYERYLWFYRILYIILQHKRLTLVSFVILAGTLGSYLFSTPQSFSAFVTIEGTNAQQSSHIDPLSTQVIQAVWSHLPMQSLLRAYFSSVEESSLLTDKFQKNYRELFRIEPQRRDSQVQLQVTTENPILSKFLASVHSQKFVSLLRKERSTAILRQVEDGEDELRQLVAQLSSLDTQYQQLAPVHAEHHAIKDDTYLNGLLSALTAATAERIKAEAAWIEATQGKGLSVQDVRELTSRKAESLLTAKQAEYSHLAQSLTDENPRMQALKAEIQSLTRDSTQKVGHFKVGLEADFRAKFTAEEELKARIEEAQQLMNSGKTQNIAREHLDTRYEHLLKKKYAIQEELSTLKRSLAALTAAVRVSEEPILPTTGKKLSLMFLASCFGILVPIGTLLTVTIASLLHNRFYDTTDIREVLRIPVLGAIPDKFSNLSPQRFQLLIQKAMQSIGLALGFAVDVTPLRTVIITSAERAEGTSTASRELAAAYARSGRRVLLIDANPHHPSQGAHFGIPSDLPGLTDVLCQAVSLSQAIQSTSVQGLMLLTSGTPTVHFEVMVGSNSMQELLYSTYSQFDNVVIDTPPALVFPCAMSLVSKVDTTVLLLDQRYTSKRGAQQAVRLLRESGGRIGGAILNRVEVGSSESVEYEHLGGQYAMPSFRSQVHAQIREMRRFFSRGSRSKDKMRKYYDKREDLDPVTSVSATSTSIAAGYSPQLPAPLVCESVVTTNSSTSLNGRPEEFNELLGTFY